MEIEQREFDQPAYATATVAPGALNIAEVTITMRNANGKPVGPTMFPLYAANDAAGNGLTSTPPSAFACKTANVLGTDVYLLFSGRAILAQTLANGTYVLSITDAAKLLHNVCVQINGRPQLVVKLATANYG